LNISAAGRELRSDGGESVLVAIVGVDVVLIDSLLTGSHFAANDLANLGNDFLPGILFASAQYDRAEQFPKPMDVADFGGELLEAAGRDLLAVLLGLRILLRLRSVTMNVSANLVRSAVSSLYGQRACEFPLNV